VFLGEGWADLILVLTCDMPDRRRQIRRRRQVGRIDHAAGVSAFLADMETLAPIPFTF
jgi:hypothetical protein